MTDTCTYCDDPVKHPDDHPDLCCDCFDISCGDAELALEKIRKLTDSVEEWRHDCNAD